VYAVVSADRISIPPGSVLRIPGSWQDFCQLRDSRGDGSIPRLRYHHGEILLMSPLPRHGREDTIDRCFTTAKEKGSGAAISELRKSLN
jgi:hypothetical protein